MKKLFFIAALGVAGMMSAKGNLVDNHTSKMDISATLVCETWVAYTSCGVAASTCASGWSDADATAWLGRLEQNYCSFEAMVREVNANLQEDGGIDWNQ